MGARHDKLVVKRLKFCNILFFAMLKKIYFVNDYFHDSLLRMCMNV